MSKTIEVSDETWEKIKDQVSPSEVIEVDNMRDFVGKKVFIQTATYHYTAKVVKIIGKMMEMEQAAWQAWQPRLTDFLRDGKTDEVEIIGQMWINVDWIVTIIPWKHTVDMVQK